MRFGLFGGASAPRTTGGDPGRGFWEYIETNVEAERLGLLDVPGRAPLLGLRAGLGPPRSPELGGRTDHIDTGRDRGARAALA
jgi:hypothetical protein